MWAMMPLLSVYWPHLFTVILVYLLSTLIYGHIRANGSKCSGNELKSPSKINEDRLSAKTINEDEIETDVIPTTFPEDTPHIPYIFDKMSEVKLKIQ